MIDWMLEVLTIFHQSLETCFKSVLLLDLYLKAEKTPKSVSDLHLIGIIAMFLASKLLELTPLRLSQVIKDICKNKFSKDQILAGEKQMFKVLNFKLTHPSIFTFSSDLFGISQLPEAFQKSIEKYANFLQKMFMYSYDLLNVFSYMQLALYSAIISMKLFQLSEPTFLCRKYIVTAIKFSAVSKSQILGDLNLLRDYVTNFKREFPFSSLHSENHYYNL